MGFEGFSIIVLFAIFVLPELIKIATKGKRKKYEYPSLPPDYDGEEVGEYSKDLNESIKDILFSDNQDKTDYQTQGYLSKIALDTLSNRSEKKLSNAELVKESSCEKISLMTRKQAAQGLIMAEIMGKPRALRPLERELPYRRPIR